VRGELTIDLERPPITGLPLSEGLKQLLLLVSSDCQAPAIAFSPNLHAAIGFEVKAMPARAMDQPFAAEFESLRRGAEGCHQGCDVEIRHEKSPRME
jgi:hypothetical protein